MNREKTVYVVPHSHWDREWYFTIEDSNILLTENIPYLMEVLENDSQFSAYTFDAQLSIVEEYLKIYPEDKERLEGLIKKRKLFIGPWYTQTDSLLVNKESIIRNLLYGTRLGNQFGHSMNIGYLPDIFGQNQYLPSIFNGFEIEYAVLQRGLYNDELKENLNFKWTSPDGNEVRANNIFLGYGPGKFLSSDEDYIKQKLIPMLEKLEGLNKDSNNLLLPAGGDQVLVRKHFPKIIEELNNKQDKYEFILSNYEDFMQNTWNKDFKNNIHGELIACQKSRIHNTIKSQRYDIKKANYDIENKILYVLEPLSVIGKSLGLRYPSTWLDKVWKTLFDAHAHDSIGGCNSDDTNKDILNRLEKAERICLGLINIIKKQITAAISKKIQKDNIFVIFNTNVQNSKNEFEGVIFSKNEKILIEDMQGNNIDFTLINREYLSGGKRVVVTAEGEKEIELPGYYRNEVIISGIEMIGLGYKTFIISDGKVKQENILNRCKDTSIENSFYKIELKNEKISLTNKITNEIITELFYFEDSKDCGDSYDYSPSQDGSNTLINNSIILEVKKCNNVKKMTLLHRSIDIKTDLELRENEEFIRVKHCVNNKEVNHRVRVVLNTNIKSTTSLSDQGFSFIERDNQNSYLNRWRENKFAEAPVSIYALENLVALKEKNKIFGVIAKGIKEFEILDNSKIALTLFRSVGLLGRDDLLWRPGRASGINNKVVYTEDAQMLREMEFEYAITLMDSKEERELFNIADKFINRYTSYQKQSLNLFEERLERFEIPLNKEVSKSEYSLIQIDNKNVIQSVCKEAYEKDGVILRLFNPGEIKEIVNIIGAKSIRLTNLYEKEIKDINDGIEISPKGYITLKLRF